MGTLIACVVTGVAGFGIGSITGAAAVLKMPLEEIAVVKETINQKLNAYRYGYQK